MLGMEAMTSERNDFSERGTAMVTVWTPWGEQRVPRADSRTASLRRMVKRLRDSESGEHEGLALS